MKSTKCTLDVCCTFLEFDYFSQRKRDLTFAGQSRYTDKEIINRLISDESKVIVIAGVTTDF